MPRPFPRKISQIKPTLSNLSLSSQYAVQFGGLSGNLRRHLKLRGVDQRYYEGDMGLLCSSAQIPGSAHATTTVTGNFQGLTETFAHTRTFTQMDLEFYVDNNYRVLKFLEHWTEFISDGSRSGPDQADNLDPNYYFRMHYPTEYKCDQTRVVKFERNYLRYIEYNFYGLFPISVTSIPVSYEGSQLLKVNASFKYDRYVSGQSRSINKFRRDDNNLDSAPSGTGPGKTDTTSRVVYEGLGYSDAFNQNSDLGRALSEITSDFAYGFGREAGNPTAREISQGRKI